jgi:copper ion binding protein
MTSGTDWETKLKKIKLTLNVSGMTCRHCEQRINQSVGRLAGVMSVVASFPHKRVTVTYNADLLKEQKIRDAIEKEGYHVRPGDGNSAVHPVSEVLPVFLAIGLLYFIIRFTVGLDFLNRIPQIDQTISWIALFTTGLMTSVHCIAMCGGINLSQSVCATTTVQNGKKETGLRNPILYNLGRVISYTVIGGIVGGLGSVLSISLTVKGIIMLTAAVFMVLMGLSMLGWLPHYLVPRLPVKWTIGAAEARSGKGPFIVGLLNGLIPCGPLQAMQIYALSTGSVLYGAFAMFLFAAGTVPLMLGAGAIFALLKGRFSRVISRVSAVLVILIAVVMFTNAAGFFGWSLSAGNPSTNSANQTKIQTASTSAVSSSGVSTLQNGYYSATIMDGYQTVTVDLKSSSYPSLKVQKGIPVRFNLRAEKKNLTGCNNAIMIPSFKLEQKLQPGDNIISFTPDKVGTIPYSCWMGMINAKILVVDKLDS